MSVRRDGGRLEATWQEPKVAWETETNLDKPTKLTLQDARNDVDGSVYNVVDSGEPIRLTITNINANSRYPLYSDG